MIKSLEMCFSHFVPFSLIGCMWLWLVTNSSFSQVIW